MISKELLGYFDNSLNAIFVVREGKIEYCNAASKKLLPRLRVEEDDTHLFKDISLSGRQGIIFMSICGKTCRVSVMPREDCVVYTIYSMGENTESVNSGFIAPACSALRDALASLKISGDLISPHFDGSEDEKIQLYRSTAAHSYFKIARIVGNLSHMENFRADAKLTMESMDIAELCSTLFDTVSSITEETGVKLTYIGPKSGVLYSGEADEIEQMVLNLLSNSFKYTPPGGEITAKLVDAKQSIVISVSDTGEGISDSVLANIFCGSSAEKKFTDIRNGVGVGLCIVRHIAERHGGSVFIDSRKGEGTRVTVSLPVKPERAGIVRTPVARYNSDGMGRILTELSDVLSYKAYMHNLSD